MQEFRSAGDFAGFLNALAMRAGLAEHRAVQASGEIVQREAKRSLGTYHEAVGPFDKWAPLADSTQERREKMGLPPNKPLLATHELRDHILTEAHGNRAAVGVPSVIVGDGTKENPSRDIGMVAAVMELGSAKVPPRPFLGRAAFVKARDSARVAAVVVGATIADQPFRNVSAATILKAAGPGEET